MRETPEFRAGQAGQARDHGCRASSKHAVRKMKKLAPGAWSEARNA
jgi:hypothetical protein